MAKIIAVQKIQFVLSGCAICGLELLFNLMQRAVTLQHLANG